MSPEAQNARMVAQRSVLRRRIRSFYGHFNREHWPKCFEFIDPKLRAQQKVDASLYAASLASFVQQYGPVGIWHVDLSLHLESKANQNDDRPFAYVYIFWKDNRHTFHVFRE